LAYLSHLLLLSQAKDTQVRSEIGRKHLITAVSFPA
jgi:hypothetical protein